MYSPIIIFSMFTVYYFKNLSQPISHHSFPVFDSQFYKLALIVSSIIAIIYLAFLIIRKQEVNQVKRNSLTKIFIGLGLFVQNSIHLRGILEIEDLEVNEFAVKIENLPDKWNNLKIAQLTDIHSSIYVSRDYLNDVISRLNSIKPDIIVLTGDYITFDTSHIPKLMKALSAVSNKNKTFAILGNHDYEDNAVPFVKGFKSIDIQLLRNENRVIDTEGSKRLNIIGLEDITQNIDLSAGLKGCSEKDINILLCHNPDFIEKAQNYPIDLMISGHTHGGVFHLPGYGPIAAPSKYLAKYAYGLFREQNTHLFVSKGVGVNGIPFRFNCKPEIAVLKLTKI